MNHGKVVPWGFEVSGMLCAEEVFVFEVVCRGDRFDEDGIVCVYELLILSAMNVLEEVVCVRVALMISRVHVLVCENEEFVEVLFKSGLWNRLCVEYDPCEGDSYAVGEVWHGQVSGWSCK